MSTYNIRLFADPSEAELAAAEQVLEDAFKNDNFSNMILGRDPALLRAFGRCVLLAGLLEGTVHVAEDTSGSIVAVAIWFGPGTEFGHTELQQEQVLKPLLDQLDPVISAWWMDGFLPMYNEMIATGLGSEDALLNSWHLQLIGVIPAYQRRGIATQMIQVVREKAFSEGHALTLEPTTEVKRQLYERMGFATKAYKYITAPQDPVGSPIWAMIDEPPKL